MIRESDSGGTNIDYLYGDDLIQQSQASTNERYYLYDGLGSTRALSDSTGAITDTYDYEAFGSVLNQTGASTNPYQFTGEQLDSSLDQYYLRARYYDQNNGRFTQMDTFAGKNMDPVTLHKYLYANADPANMIDPSGRFSLGSVMAAINIASTLHSVATTTIDVFQFATGEGEVTASQIGSGILLSFLPGASGLKILKMSNLKRKVNGNSKKSTKPQHVYKITDTLDFDIYKFGISGAALNKNGTSRRANIQANALNKSLAFKRYIPMVLVKNVPGRIAALTIEKTLVCAYKKANGRNPIGNKLPRCN